MNTALEVARNYFQSAVASGKAAVTNTDLHRTVMNLTGQSRDVVHGTLDCTGPGTLIASDWYTRDWHKDKLDSGRVIHRRNVGTVNITAQREMNFDFATKRASCARIMSHLPRTGRPRLLTLASATGNCVRAAVERNPNVEIYNVESLPDVLTLWKARKRQLGIRTTDYLCMFQDYVNAPGFADIRFALINADVMGYACKSMYEYLTVINRAKNAKVVAVTTQCLTQFRNHGTFQDALRKKYAGSADKHAECIADWLPDYEMIDRYDYKKDEHSARMEVFIFTLAV